MSSRRVLILVVSLVLGAMGIFLLFQYTNSSDDRARKDETQVKVLVATRAIKTGEPVPEPDKMDGFAKVDEAPVRLKPETAISNIESVRGLIAIHEIAAGQFLTTNDFKDPSQAAQVTKSETLEDPSLTAVTLSIDQVRAVAGLLNPGDFVNIMVPYTFDSKATPVAGYPSNASGQGYQLLYQKAKILAVGQAFSVSAQQASTGQSAGTSSSLITMAVTPEAALRLAANSGSLYLSLVRQDYQPAAVPDALVALGSGTFQPPTPANPDPRKDFGTRVPG